MQLNGYTQEELLLDGFQSSYHSSSLHGPFSYGDVSPVAHASNVNLSTSRQSCISRTTPQAVLQIFLPFRTRDLPVAAKTEDGTGVGMTHEMDYGEYGIIAVVAGSHT